MVGRLRSGVLRAVHAWRRRRLTWRIRLAALVKGASVEVELAPGVRITGRVAVSVGAGSRTTVRIGADTVLEDDVLLLLDGGRLEVGPRVRIRRGVVLRVRGELTFAGDNFLSYYSVVHCDERITVGRFAAIGEHVTLTDGAHVKVEDGWYIDHLATAPVHLADEAWVGAKATIGRGVTIGHGSWVAANAVVVRDVPAEVIVGGVPAAVLGEHAVTRRQVPAS